MPFDVSRVISAYQAGAQLKHSKQQDEFAAQDRQFEIERRQLELKALKLAEKQKARDEALQQAALLQGQPGTIPGANLGATPGGPREDIGSAQPYQPVQGPPQNDIQALLMKARQQPVPLQEASIPGAQTPATQPAVPIPGVYGPDVLARPQSSEQMTATKEAQTVQDAVLKMQLDRQKELGQAYNLPEGSQRMIGSTVIGENPKTTESKTPTLTPQFVNVDGKLTHVLHDSQGNYFDGQTHAPIVGRITPYVAPPTPRAKGEITPTAEASLQQNLNNQWQKASKDVQDLNRANAIMQSGMEAARRGDMNAGSQAVLVTFQKFLDPTSVVRESEYARSGAGLAMGERIRGYIGKLEQGGAGVTLPELEKFAQLGKEINQRLTAEGKSLLDAEKKRISSVAERYGLPPEMVISGYNFSATGTQPSTINQPSGPKKGEVQDGYEFLGGDPSQKSNWKKK